MTKREIIKDKTRALLFRALTVFEYDLENCTVHDSNSLSGLARACTVCAGAESTTDESKVKAIIFMNE